MLQFIAKENDRYSVPELAQMAIEGGCRWIVWQPGSLDEPQIRELASELVPLCRESEVILTMVDHLELAKDLQIHGVLLTDGRYTLAQAREICGPEAVIGIMVDDADQALPMRGMRLDLDYLAMTDDMPIPDIAANVARLREGGFDLPVVAQGDYPAELAPALMLTGINGLALGAAIADADDPVVAVEHILKEITPQK